MATKSLQISLSPKEKAAVLLASLGDDYAVELSQHLSDDEISEITREIDAAKRIPHGAREKVVREFYGLCLARKLIADGGYDYARGILETTFGRAQTDTILYELAASEIERPYGDNPGGPGVAAMVLDSLDPNAERQILQGLDASDSTLAAELKRQLFSFEDIALLSGRALQRVLMYVPTTDLALALQLAGDDVIKAVFSNLPKRLQIIVRDDMEIVRPTRIRDVEDARARIADVVLRLKESGEIVVKLGKDVTVA